MRPSRRRPPFRGLWLLFWVLTAGWWVLIATLTHLPPGELPRVPGTDKTHHLLAYAALALLLGFALLFTFPRRWWLPWGVLVIGMCYGALDEVTQAWVGRSAELDDWIANVVGTAAGILPVLIVQRVLNVPARAREVRPPRPPARSASGAGLGEEVEAALTRLEAARSGGSGQSPRRSG